MGDIYKGVEGYNNQAFVENHELTGLFYNNSFFKNVDARKKNISQQNYMMVALDIEHFKLFNKLYGRKEGDKLLVYIADCLKRLQDSTNSVAGYIGGDNFGILMPKRMELLERLRLEIVEGIKSINNTMGFLPAFGVYIIDDNTIPAITMYDRATIALSHVIGNYTKRVCEYDADMTGKLEEELKILSDIQEGIDKDEFIFHIQPQCDISTGKIVGGESLVRWNHGDKGMVPPSLFVPILEKNGFIADLDRCVWEKVCAWLRDWIDRGYKPVPISINVSRIDIFSMDVPTFLKGLMDKYNLPSNLLKVEITESAYADNNDKIIRTVKQLRDSSFLVMMDDFGSGYSSLNMLKSVAVDVLKIDMRFLDIDDADEEKGIGILESVVNMARQMKIPIIVEGVETQKQENFLLRMGCRYTQGFYYYRPMTVEAFEKLIEDERRLDFEGIWCKQVEQIHARELVDINLFSDSMVNNILGPVAFYELYENRIEITRVNEPYYKFAGIDSAEGLEKGKKFWSHVRDDDRHVLFNIFEMAYERPSVGAEGYVHYIKTDGTVMWVHMRVFFMRENDGRKIFYSSLTDMSFLEEKKKKENIHTHGINDLSDKQIENLDKYYGNLPYGYGVGKVVLDEDEQPCGYELVYANHEAAKVTGGDRKRLHILMLKALGENKQAFCEKAYRVAYFGEVAEHTLYSKVSYRYLHMTMFQYEHGYVACIIRDVTHNNIYEHVLNSVANTYREVYFVNLKENYCRMIYPDENHLLERGVYSELVNRHFANGTILKYNEENVRKFFDIENLRNVLMTEDIVEFRHRRSINGKGEEWCRASFSVSEREDGKPKTAILTIRSIESFMREQEEKSRERMAESLAGMSDGFFIYNATGNEKIQFVNPPVLEMFGCKNIEEFREFTGNSFKGMVHPDDYKRISSEISEQIKHSDNKMDYIHYRIVRKDGTVRWIDDCGHLEVSTVGEGSKLFYVFIRDITDEMTAQQKSRLLALNEHYNIQD